MGHLLHGEKKHPNNIFGFKTYPWAFLYFVVQESDSNRPLSFICAVTGHLSVSGQSLYNLTSRTRVRTWSMEHQTQVRDHCLSHCDDRSFVMVIPARRMMTPGQDNLMITLRGHGAMVSDQGPGFLVYRARPLARRGRRPGSGLSLPSPASGLASPGTRGSH